MALLVPQDIWRLETLELTQETGVCVNYLKCCEDVKYSVERKNGLILSVNGLSMALCICVFVLMYFIFCE